MIWQVTIASVPTVFGQLESISDVLRVDFTSVCGADRVRTGLLLQPVAFLLLFGGLHSIGRSLQFEAHRTVGVRGLLGPVHRIRRRDRRASPGCFFVSRGPRLRDR